MSALLLTALMLDALQVEGLEAIASRLLAEMERRGQESFRFAEMAQVQSRRELCAGVCA